MKVFYLKVKTRQDFDSPEHFKAKLEELKPSLYSSRTEMAEEDEFADIKVLDIKELSPFG
jgi:hypothetical protein